MSDSVSPSADKAVANLTASALLAALWGVSLALGLGAELWRGAAVSVAVLGSGWLAAAMLLTLVHRLFRKRGWEQVQDLLGILARLARSCSVPLLVGGLLVMASLWWRVPNLPFALYLNVLAVMGGFLWGYYDFNKTSQAVGYPRYYPALWGLGLAFGVGVGIQALTGA